MAREAESESGGEKIADEAVDDENEVNVAEGSGFVEIDKLQDLGKDTIFFQYLRILLK